MQDSDAIPEAKPKQKLLLSEQYSVAVDALIISITEH